MSRLYDILNNLTQRALAQEVKSCIATHTFTFNNGTTSDTASLSTLSGGKVTTNNIKGVLLDCAGAYFTAGRDSSGNVFATFPQRALTGSYTCTVTMFYS